MLNNQLRHRFDQLLDEVISALPKDLQRLLDEVSLVVDDHPSPKLLAKLGKNHPYGLCGLYTGIPLTRRSTQHSGVLPDNIYIFRDGIIESEISHSGKIDAAVLKQNIRKTVLHEIGHHFGLSEEDLRQLGYQ